MKERRTDLALETKESFPGDGGEIEGVSLYKETDNNLTVSTVEIFNEKGREAMKKPIGSYITVETGNIMYMSDEDYDNTINSLGGYIERLTGKLKSQSVMVVGLGNRQVTADSLGPIVIDNLEITRHYAKEFGESFLKKYDWGEVCALSPGVMAQTGMETEEIISSLVTLVKPDIVIVIDALAARSVSRVTTTIQITNTGINPGSGVGNHRRGLNEESLGTKVVAIGVPTVVEAEVIVYDRIEEFMRREGFSEQEIGTFINDLGEPEIEDMYVTPKNIDETVQKIGELIASTINELMH